MRLWVGAVMAPGEVDGRYAPVMESIRVVWAGERQAHVVAPDGRATAWYESLVSAQINGVEEVVLGSRTLQVRVARDADAEKTLASVRALLGRSPVTAEGYARREIEIPVCYDADLGPDLASLASRAGMDADAAADLHAAGEYTVRLLGFSPGFAYMDGLAERLRSARLESPRPRVRAGSVGIAGSRCGIYPQATPGGWNLVGATPLRLFDPSRDPAAMLAAGDRVRVRRIGRDEFDALAEGRA